MNSYKCIAIGAVAVFAAAGGGSAYAQPSQLSQRAQIELYDGPNYSGQRVTVRAGEDGSNLVSLGFNDRASSLRVTGDWEVCYHVNYGGQCRRFSMDAASLGNFDNQISSVRILVPNNPGRPTVPPNLPPDAPRTGIRLYDGANYSGQRFDAATDETDLSRNGFNDRASSLVMARGESWEVCMDARFRSQCRTFSDAVANLADYGFDDRISSLRRVGGGPVTPGRPTVPPGGGGGGGNGLTQITGQTQGANGAGFFPIPRANGAAIDHCARSRDYNCGDSGADAICRMSGYREAIHYTLVDPRRYGGTVHIEDGIQCSGGNCRAIVDLLCTNN